MGAVLCGVCYAADAYQFALGNMFPSIVMAFSGAYLSWRWIYKSYEGMLVGAGLGVVADYILMDWKKDSKCASAETAAEEIPILIGKAVVHLWEDEWDIIWKHIFHL
jgi:hypothetical protein